MRYTHNSNMFAYCKKGMAPTTAGNINIMINGYTVQ